MSVNPIQMLLTMANTMGPQVAEAQSQLAGLQAQVAATNAEMAATTAAAGDASAALGMSSLGITAIAIGAGVAVVGLALAFKGAADNMYAMGQQSERLEILGSQLDEAQKKAADFYINMQDVNANMATFGNNLSRTALPALDQLSKSLEHFTELLVGLSQMKPIDWKSILAISPIADVLAMSPGTLPGVAARLAGDYLATNPDGGGPREMGYVHGQGNFHFQPKPGKPFRWGNNKGNPYAGMFDVPWEGPDYNPEFASPDMQMRDLGGTKSNDQFKTLIQVQDWLAKVKVPALALTEQMQYLHDKETAVANITATAARTMAQDMSRGIQQMVYDVAAGTGSIAQDFRDLLSSILADIASAAAQQGVGLLLESFSGAGPIGAFVGSIGGHMLGHSSAGGTVINVSALSSKDMVRSIISPSGEFNQTNRQLAYAQRLP